MWSEFLDKFTDEQITSGLEKCKSKYEWPPSMAEFRNAALNIIPSGRAWVLAKSDNCDDELILRCKQMIGSWNWNNHSEEDVRREFIDTYNLLADEL